MKNRLRFLSLLIIAVMALSLSSAALAAPGDAGGLSVYIPDKIGRLRLPDMPEYIALFTRTQSVATYGNPDDPNDPCPILPVSEPDIELYFSEQPDWAGVLWPEGFERISVDGRGYARVSSAGHETQPGVTPGTMLNDKGERVWAATTADHKAGDPAPTGDGAFMACKDDVTVLYNRNGSPVWVEFVIPEDFHKTGMAGAITTVRYERVNVELDCYLWIDVENDDGTVQRINKPFEERFEVLERDSDYNPTEWLYEGKKVTDFGPLSSKDVWYISQVVTEYPEDVNYIVRVETNWKNNSGQFLWGYRITYATSADERYKITYMPYTATILEDHNENRFYEWYDPTYPSTDLEAYFNAVGDTQSASDFKNMYLHHYEEDTPIYGEYTNLSQNLVSGSGEYLPYWYEEGHGARVYRYSLRPCTYFKSPRYK